MTTFGARRSLLLAGSVLLLAGASCGPPRRPELRQGTKSYLFTITSDPIPPRAREDVIYTITVKDRETKETFTHEESEVLLRGFLSGALYEHGLICRADDRGEPVVQLSPPLIADTPEFEEIDRILRLVLTEAWDRIVGRGSRRAVAARRDPQ